jgi:2-polyprenyl-6-methoxyphenol hydroxylase-like FAD-dependent oxidoreductase
VNQELQGDRPSILIVGGGIGGMATAIAFSQRGFAVDLVEADAGWRVYGAGITLISATYRAFAELGMLEELKQLSFPSRGGTVVCDGDGTVMIEAPGLVAAPHCPTLGGIMRPVLHEMMSRQTLERGVDVRLGVRVTHWLDGPEGIRVSFSDGKTRDYTAVIVADGAFSQTRRELFPEAPEPEYTGQFCWRLVADRPADIDRLHIYSADRKFAGLVPTSDEQMYMWLLEPRDTKSRVEPGTEHLHLAELMAPFGGILGALRDQLDSKSVINVRPLDVVLLRPPWHKGRVLLIGDAAHATTPHLASGAGLAVEDAVVLASLFERPGTVESKFSQFMDARWDRCRDVVESSVAIGAMQQSPDGSPEKLVGLIGPAEQRLRAPMWSKSTHPSEEE